MRRPLGPVGLRPLLLVLCLSASCSAPRDGRGGSAPSQRHGILLGAAAEATRLPEDRPPALDDVLVAVDVGGEATQLGRRDPGCDAHGSSSCGGAAAAPPPPHHQREARDREPRGYNPFAAAEAALAAAAARRDPAAASPWWVPRSSSRGRGSRNFTLGRLPRASLARFEEEERDGRGSSHSWERRRPEPAWHAPPLMPAAAAAAAADDDGHEALHFAGLSAGALWRWRERVREAVGHAYGSYLGAGWPGDELRPLSCRPRTSGDRERGTLDDVLGGYSLTLVDALDTLAVIGDFTGFRCGLSRVVTSLRFDAPVAVSVFEASIRVIGGLLSAHLLASDPALGLFNATLHCEPWRSPAACLSLMCGPECGASCLPVYSGEALVLAEELARRLLPAFDTPTGLPYHRINLATGVVDPSSDATCTAAAGTFLLEWGLLSRLTGDPTYEAVARRAVGALWSRRGPGSGLVGSAIDASSGSWRSSHTGIGAGVDSFYEYTLKAGVALDDEAYVGAWHAAAAAVDASLAVKGRVGRHRVTLHAEANTHDGALLQRPPVVSALQAYYPGLQVLAGDVTAASASATPLLALWYRGAALPELWDLGLGQGQGSVFDPPPASPAASGGIGGGGLLHFGRDAPLRPELLESLYHLWTATDDPRVLAHIGRMTDALVRLSRVPCGFAAVADLGSPRFTRAQGEGEGGGRGGVPPVLDAAECGECGDSSSGVLPAADDPTMRGDKTAAAWSGGACAAASSSSSQQRQPHLQLGYRLDDRMDSYLLAETLKYAFLAFDDALRRWGTLTAGTSSSASGAEGERKGTTAARRRDASVAATPSPAPLTPAAFLAPLCASASAAVGDVALLVARGRGEADGDAGPSASAVWTGANAAAAALSTAAAALLPPHVLAAAAARSNSGEDGMPGFEAVSQALGGVLAVHLCEGQGQPEGSGKVDLSGIESVAVEALLGAVWGFATGGRAGPAWHALPVLSPPEGGDDQAAAGGLVPLLVAGGWAPPSTTVDAFPYTAGLRRAIVGLLPVATNGSSGGEGRGPVAAAYHHARLSAASSPDAHPFLGVVASLAPWQRPGADVSRSSDGRWSHEAAAWRREGGGGWTSIPPSPVAGSSSTSSGGSAASVVDAFLPWLEVSPTVPGRLTTAEGAAAAGAAAGAGAGAGDLLRTLEAVGATRWGGAGAAPSLAVGSGAGPLSSSLFSTEGHVLPLTHPQLAAAGRRRGRLLAAAHAALAPPLPPGDNATAAAAATLARWAAAGWWDEEDEKREGGGAAPLCQTPWPGSGVPPSRFVGRVAAFGGTRSRWGALGGGSDSEEGALSPPVAFPPPYTWRHTHSLSPSVVAQGAAGHWDPALRGCLSSSPPELLSSPKRRPQSTSPAGGAVLPPAVAAALPLGPVEAAYSPLVTDAVETWYWGDNAASSSSFHAHRRSNASAAVASDGVPSPFALLPVSLRPAGVALSRSVSSLTTCPVSRLPPRLPLVPTPELCTSTVTAHLPEGCEDVLLWQVPELAPPDSSSSGSTTATLPGPDILPFATPLPPSTALVAVSSDGTGGEEDDDDDASAGPFRLSLATSWDEVVAPALRQALRTVLLRQAAERNAAAAAAANGEGSKAAAPPPPPPPSAAGAGGDGGVLSSVVKLLARAVSQLGGSSSSSGEGSAALGPPLAVGGGRDDADAVLERSWGTVVVPARSEEAASASATSDMSRLTLVPRAGASLTVAVGLAARLAGATAVDDAAPPLPPPRHALPFPWAVTPWSGGVGPIFRRSLLLQAVAQGVPPALPASNGPEGLGLPILALPALGVMERLEIGCRPPRAGAAGELRCGIAAHKSMAPPPLLLSFAAVSADGSSGAGAWDVSRHHRAVPAAPLPVIPATFGPFLTPTGLNVTAVALASPLDACAGTGVTTLSWPLPEETTTRVPVSDGPEESPLPFAALVWRGGCSFVDKVKAVVAAAAAAETEAAAGGSKSGRARPRRLVAVLVVDPPSPLAPTAAAARVSEASSSSSSSFSKYKKTRSASGGALTGSGGAATGRPSVIVGPEETSANRQSVSITVPTALVVEGEAEALLRGLVFSEASPEGDRLPLPDTPEDWLPGVAPSAPHKLGAVVPPGHALFLRSSVAWVGSSDALPPTLSPDWTALGQALALLIEAEAANRGSGSSGSA